MANELITTVTVPVTGQVMGQVQVQTAATRPRTAAQGAKTQTPAQLSPNDTTQVGRARTPAERTRWLRGAHADGPSRCPSALPPGAARGVSLSQDALRPLTGRPAKDRKRVCSCQGRREAAGGAQEHRVTGAKGTSGPQLRAVTHQCGPEAGTRNTKNCSQRGDVTVCTPRMPP